MNESTPAFSAVSIQAEPVVLLRQILSAGAGLQECEDPQLRMLGVRVHSLARSFLDSVVVDDDLMGPNR